MYSMDSSLNLTYLRKESGSLKVDEQKLPKLKNKIKAKRKQVQNYTKKKKKIYTQAYPGQLKKIKIIERILKKVKEKLWLLQGKANIKITSNLSLKTMQAERE